MLRSCRLLITSSALARLGSAQLDLFEAAAAFLIALIHHRGRRRQRRWPYKARKKLRPVAYIHIYIYIYIYIYIAATVATTTTSKAGRKNLISRTLQRCKSGLSAAGGGGGSSGQSSPPGCFSVYVGPERERFVVRAECANHPLFRRLLDDAEREYGYAAQGPLALPGCDVDAFLDVLWQMERADADEEVTAAASSPICGLHSGSKGRAAGYRMISSSPTMVGRRK